MTTVDLTTNNNNELVPHIVLGDIGDKPNPFFQEQLLLKHLGVEIPIDETGDEANANKLPMILFNLCECQFKHNTKEILKLKATSEKNVDASAEIGRYKNSNNEIKRVYNQLKSDNQKLLRSLELLNRPELRVMKAEDGLMAANSINEALTKYWERLTKEAIKELYIEDKYTALAYRKIKELQTNLNEKKGAFWDAYTNTKDLNNDLLLERLIADDNQNNGSDNNIDELLAKLTNQDDAEKFYQHAEHIKKLLVRRVANYKKYFGIKAENDKLEPWIADALKELRLTVNDSSMTRSIDIDQNTNIDQNIDISRCNGEEAHDIQYIQPIDIDNAIEQGRPNDTDIKHRIKKLLVTLADLIYIYKKLKDGIPVKSRPEVIKGRKTSISSNRQLLLF